MEPKEASGDFPHRNQDVQYNVEGFHYQQLRPSHSNTDLDQKQQ